MWTGKDERLEVLARPAFANRAVNPYNARICKRLPQHGITVREYGFPQTLRPADLVHVHWPESSFNHGLFGAVLTTEALLLTLGWQRRRGAKVVWTVHNLRAHERRYPGREASFWTRFLPLVDAIVALGPDSLERARAERPQLRDKPAFVIPHPHYRGEYVDEVSREAARVALDLPRRAPVVVAFGQVKAYKNIPALVRTCLAIPGTHLVVAGKPRDAALRAEVEAAAGDSDRVHLHLRHIPSDRAQLFLRAADLVALPYRDILNSGSALLALSFDRPVWLPDGPLASQLSAMVPGPWILRGQLDPASLEAALDAASETAERTDGQHLAAFDPARIALEHAQMYRAVARLGESTRHR